MAHSLEESFNNVYTKLKLQFYKRVFQRLESREARLSTMEAFSVEVIDALGTPTVSEFADFLGISVANAAYKVQNLTKKGYLRKERSEEDHRESHLHVTQRFENYKDLHNKYINTVLQRVKASCTKEEIAAFQLMLDKINSNFTPEVDLGTFK